MIRPTLEHTEETLRATIDNNLWTIIRSCLALLPQMAARGGGRIVNIGAESVRNGLTDHAMYNAAKGGVHGPGYIPLRWWRRSRRWRASCPRASERRWPAGAALSARAQGIVERISASTVHRWLRADVLKPWQHRSWIFPRDPYFAFKATRALDLYARIWNGRPLGGKDFVLSADEKPGVQAKGRVQPTMPPGPGRPARVEAEYVRRGTLACFAAYDVHRAHVIGRCEPTTGMAPFGRLVDQVMTTEPYASARRVFWIVDNGASHRNWAAAARMNDAYPNAHMVHLPVHASWLNQVEIYFSILARKALKPDDFADLDAVAERLTAFEHHYNLTATPFDWTFTHNDLNQLLTRIGRHDPTAPHPLNVG